VMMRNKNTGALATLIHVELQPSTCVADGQPSRVIDDRLQIASLGLMDNRHPRLVFCFPGREGERSYLNQSPVTQGHLLRNDVLPKKWVERFHPLQFGVTHRYKVLVLFTRTTGFSEAVREVWRCAFGQLYRIPVPQSDISAACTASLNLIANWCRPYQGY